MSESILPPLPDKFQLGDRSIEVKALNMGQLLRVLDLFKGGKLEQLNASGDVLDWLEKLPEEMIALVMIATGLTREEMNELETDQFVLLLSAILEKNRDFFFRKLGPALRALLGRVALVAGILDGSMLSSFSSATGTRSTPSSATPGASSAAS